MATLAARQKMPLSVSELFPHSFVCRAGLDARAFRLYWPSPVDSYSKNSTGFDRDGG